VRYESEAGMTVHDETSGMMTNNAVLVLVVQTSQQAGIKHVHGEDRRNMGEGNGVVANCKGQPVKTVFTGSI